MTVRVRFAPSPTGDPHIGNVRTVVFNWLFARKMGGQFILRIEDTDRTRYQPGSVTTIMEGLRWLGLDWDEGPDREALETLGVEEAEAYAVGGPVGPYVQSERLPTYREIAETLVDQGWAYRCNCPPERLERVRERQRAQKQPLMYDRHCRNLPQGAVSPDEPHVIRLKAPLQGETVVHDAIRGDIHFDNAGIDDQVLLKSDGFPTYHLAVVVDDYFMKITHVIRGDDWIPSTPKRILIYQALGWDLPVYCHVPLVTMPGGKKLAKREGATSITEFREAGYLPEALFNFLALLGWSPGAGEEQEIFSRQALIEQFDLFRVNRAPASFAYDKLNWMNGVYIREMAEEELLEHLLPFWQRAGLVEEPCPEETWAKLRLLVPLVQERLKYLDEVVEWTAFALQEIDPPPAERLVAKKMTAEESLEALRRLRALMAEVEPFAAETLEQAMRDLADEMDVKAGPLFGMTRWAVTAQQVSPPLFGSLEAVGRERVVARFERAIQALEESDLT